jgi:alanine dehydrogenase
VDDVRQAVEGMDIVVSSVPKLEQHPVRGAWWSAGALMIPLDVTGAWDDDLYRVADVIACDGEENLRRAFERFRPNLRLDPERILKLQTLAAGQGAGRRSAADRVLAFVTGIASLDVVLAWEIFRRADATGRGRRFDLTS